MKRTIAGMAFSLACLMNLSEAQTINHDKVEMENGKNTGMCDKLPMKPDGIVRLSKIEVHSEYLEEYVKCAIEVGEISLRTEPGVLTMYAVAERTMLAELRFLKLTPAKRHISRTSHRPIFRNTSRKRYTWLRHWFYPTRRH